MHVGVDGAGRGDQTLSGHDGGAGADHDINTAQRVRVAGPPE